MSARKSANKINLLPATEFAKSVWGRILTWALSTFRVIVIVTEMVVMLAFISRFWLDAKMNDLNDLIKQKTGIVTSWSEFENTFKTTQKKLSIFSQVSQNFDSVSSFLAKITSYLPNELKLISYTYSPTQIIIKGQSIDEKAIAQLAANLINDRKSFAEVVIENVETNVENPAYLDFSLKLNLAKENQ